MNAVTKVKDDVAVVRRGLPDSQRVDVEALAGFVPVRAVPVSQLPASGAWRVRTEQAVFVFDLEAGASGTVCCRGARLRGHLGLEDGQVYPLGVVGCCVVGEPLVFTVAGAGQGAVARCGGEDRVVYLELLDPRREQRAGEHLAGWADVSLPDELRNAHLCAAAHFGARWAQLGRAVGVSSRVMRMRWYPVVEQALVALRAGRGEPERVPLSSDGSLPVVPKWMTEERLRRRASPGRASSRRTSR